MVDEESRPAWWQPGASPRFNYVLGGGNLMVAVLSWMIVFISDDLRILHVIVATMFSLLALAYIGTAAATQRRSRTKRAD